MWGQNDIVMPLERAIERLVHALWLNREHIKGRPGHMTALNGGIKALISTTVPREALITMAPSFICANVWALMRFSVSAPPGTCKVTTSELANSCASDAQDLALPNGSLASTS